MRFIVAAVLTGMTLAPLASAQKLELKFDALAARASEKAEVDLDGSILKLLPQLLSKDDRDGKSPVIEVLGGLREIHVRNYEFDKTGAYTDADLEPLRKQVSEGSGWSRIVHVKEDGESTEVFMQTQGGKIGSCLILSAESRELSVVYLVGTMTVAQMKGLADPSAVDSLAALAQLRSK
jgi:hypothetical protein